MRCSADSHTLPLDVVPRLPAERVQLPLPVIEPAPDKPPRTTQAERMQRMAYTGPKERPRCETCQHAQTIAEGGYLIRCELGGFPVLRGGLCREFERWGRVPQR
jgi:hypothetical protein